MFISLTLIFLNCTFYSWVENKWFWNRNLITKINPKPSYSFKFVDLNFFERKTNVFEKNYQILNIKISVTYISTRFQKLWNIFILFLNFCFACSFLSVFEFLQFYYICQRGCLFFNFANPPFAYQTRQKTKQNVFKI